MEFPGDFVNMFVICLVCLVVILVGQGVLLKMPDSEISHRACEDVDAQHCHNHDDQESPGVTHGQTPGILILVRHKYQRKVTFSIWFQ